MKRVIPKLVTLFFIIVWKSSSPQFVLYNVLNSGLYNNNIGVLKVGPDDTKWIGSQFTLNTLDAGNTNWTLYNNLNSPFGTHYVVRVLPGINDTWIGTYGDGLHHYDGTSWTSYTSTNSGLPSDYIYGIVKIGNNLWIATKTGGIARFDGTNFLVYNTSNGLPTNYIMCLMKDVSGNLWAGTGDHGLLMFNGTQWTNYTPTNSNLPAVDVYEVSVDYLGNVWAGTSAGLWQLPPSGPQSVFNTGNSQLPHNYIRCIKADGFGRIWIATHGGGLAGFNPTSNSWILFNALNSNLPDDLLWNVDVDMERNIWVASNSSGLAMLSFSLTGLEKAPVKELPGKIQLSLSGNQLLVHFSDNIIKTGSLYLLSSVGRIIREWKVFGPENVSFDLSDIQAAVYILRYISDSGIMISSKFVRTP